MKNIPIGPFQTQVLVAIEKNQTGKLSISSIAKDVGRESQYVISRMDGLFRRRLIQWVDRQTTKNGNISAQSIIEITPSGKLKAQKALLI